MEYISGGKTMNDKLIVGMVIVFVVFSIFQLVQINSLKNSLGVNGASTGTTKVSARSNGGGETYEEMMARMHPGQAVSKGSSSSAPSMVGGC